MQFIFEIMLGERVVVKFEAFFDSKSRKVISIRFSNHVHSGYECNAPNMPDDFKKCKGIVAAWGMGGDPFYFPPEAGYPVGEEHGGSTYYMLEIHYDNPGNLDFSFKSIIFDSPNILDNP